MPDDALPAITPELRALRGRYAAFMEEHVYPNERALSSGDNASDALVADLRSRAKAAGMWAPHIGSDAGGTGRGFLAYAFLNEVIGRSYWGQLVFGCQAPDAGNSEILHTFGTPEQRRELLAPLVQPTEPIQELQMGCWTQERLVVALAMDVHQRAPGGLQHGQRHGAAIEARGAAAADANLSRQDQDVVGVVKLDLVGQANGTGEGGFDDGPIRPGSHQCRSGPIT